MSNETEEVYDIAFSAVEQEDSGGSGIPKKFIFGSPNFQVFKSENQINIYPPSGGCICIYRDGTWAGDIAPFCD